MKQRNYYPTTLLIFLFSLLGIFGIFFLNSTFVFSQEESKENSKANDVALGSIRRIASGTVESIDYIKGKLAIKELIDGQSSLYRRVTVIIDKNTQISKGFGNTLFSSLMIGDKATVEYRQKNGDNIAFSIVVAASEVVKSKSVK